MWELLRRLKPISSAPWILLGDFNEAMWSFEHFFAWNRHEKHIVELRDILAHYEVHDLGFIGVP
jgi:hypothetical protein